MNFQLKYLNKFKNNEKFKSQFRETKTFINKN